MGAEGLAILLSATGLGAMVGGIWLASFGASYYGLNQSVHLVTPDLCAELCCSLLCRVIYGLARP